MATIRLSKQNKTIKVVNRRETIRLSQDQNEITLKHTGKVGPQGETGPKGDPGIFVGPNAPPSPVFGDLWVDTD